MRFRIFEHPADRHSDSSRWPISIKHQKIENRRPLRVKLQAPATILIRAVVPCSPGPFGAAQMLEFSWPMSYSMFYGLQFEWYVYNTMIPNDRRAQTVLYAAFIEVDGNNRQIQAQREF